MKNIKYHMRGRFLTVITAQLGFTMLDFSVAYLFREYAFVILK